jgi:hypothetical protein
MSATAANDHRYPPGYAEHPRLTERNPPFFARFLSVERLSSAKITPDRPEKSRSGSIFRDHDGRVAAKPSPLATGWGGGG